MATMNFSVPDHVRDAFNETFAGQNKSAIAAKYLMQAVEDERRVIRDADFVDRMKRRLAKQTRAVSAADVRKIRDDGRS